MTVFASSTVTEHVPEPLQESLTHSTNLLPDVVVAVNVTVVPRGNKVEHTLPQLIPEGLDVTVPKPAPDFETFNAGRELNVAVTDFADDIEMTHEPEEFEHAPDQPEKTFPLVGVAVRVTVVPELKFFVQVLELPQEIPDGRDVTEPEPTVVTVNSRGTTANVAVTVTAPVIVTMQEPVPVQAPDQPVKALPPVGSASNEITVS